jgi:XTP/dITP diphosphohydrolase
LHRKFTDKNLLIASHNSGKVREIAALLAPYPVSVDSIAALGLPEPEETGDSFVANAALKARAAALATGSCALADDSGLVVPALGGAPGIYSARWAGVNKDFTQAINRLEKALAAHKSTRTGDWPAHFICVLSLAWPDGHCENFTGRVDGHLVFPARGTAGFGYDPVFRPNGETLTYGEIDPAVKAATSHRAHAFRQLIKALF